MSRKEKPEHAFQREVAARLREDRFIIVDCDITDGLKFSPCSGKGSFIAAHKARGWTKGQPDLIIAKNGRVAFLELKFGTGKQSIEQVQFGLRCAEQFIDYRIIRNHRDLDDIMEEINRSSVPDF